MHIQVALSWKRDKKNSHLKTDRDLNDWTLAKVLRLLFMGYISVLLSGRHFLWHLGHKLKQAWTHYAKLSLSKFLIHIVEAFANCIMDWWLNVEEKMDSLFSDSCCDRSSRWRHGVHQVHQGSDDHRRCRIVDQRKWKRRIADWLKVLMVVYF